VDGGFSRKSGKNHPAVPMLIITNQDVTPTPTRFDLPETFIQQILSQDEERRGSSWDKSL
jgi:hypothetical protein